MSATTSSAPGVPLLPMTTAVGGGVFRRAGRGSIANSTIEGNLAADARRIGTQGELEITHAHDRAQCFRLPRCRCANSTAASPVSWTRSSARTCLPTASEYPAPHVLVQQRRDRRRPTSGPANSCKLGTLTPSTRLGPARLLWRSHTNDAAAARVSLGRSTMVSTPGSTWTSAASRAHSWLPRCRCGRAAGASPPAECTPAVSPPMRISCDLDRNGRVDFADLDRLIASFRAEGRSLPRQGRSTAEAVRRQLYACRMPCRGPDQEARRSRLDAGAIAIAEPSA